MPAQDNIFELKVKKALSKMPALSGGVLVGFSGGADSRALLDILLRLSKEQNFQIAAAHLNHGIRGHEANRDELFCQKICLEYGIPFFSEKLDIPAISRESGIGIEEAARNARYGFFARICSENPEYSYIATAHNADDSLETMLFNLCRGSGGKGLCGIPPIRDNILRPLIYLSKKEILQYCAQNALDFVSDSTNDSLDYSRNKIRHTVLAPLCDIFPSAYNSASRAAELLRCDCDCLDSLAQDYLYSRTMPLKVSELSELHRAIASRVIALACKEAGVGTIESSHIEAILENLGAIEPKDLSLPSGVTLHIEKGLLFFKEDVACPPYEYKLSEGLNEIPRTDYAVFLATPDTPVKYDTNIYNLFIKLPINSATINGLTARNRRSGDKILSAGMSHSVKKLLCDMKLTLAERSRLPFICDESGNLLAAGNRVSDKCKSSAEEGYFVLILKKTIDSDIEETSKESL